MPINEQEFASVKQTLDTLMTEFLPKFATKLNTVAKQVQDMQAEHDARIAELKTELELLKAQPAAPAAPEKPKRKRRTKAELEAAKAEAEQAEVDAAVDAAMANAEDPVDELPAEDTPAVVGGIAITGKTVQSILMLHKQCNEDVAATAQLAQQYGCPGETVAYVLALTDAERADICQRFPLQ